MKETLAQKIKVWYYFFSTQLKDIKMRCMCGATDCKTCGPLQGYSLHPPTERELELALDSVIECIMEDGQWPKNGRAQFDLYEYLLDNRDPSYAYELLATSMSSNTHALDVRIERERKTVEAMLRKHLAESDMVADHAAEEYA
jgi:hypothetical protein